MDYWHRLKLFRRKAQVSLRVGTFLAYRQIKRANKWTTLMIVFVMVLTFLNLVVVSGLLLGLITGSFGAYRESYTGEVIITSESGLDHIENSQALVSFLRNHPKVRVISPRYETGSSILGTLTANPKKNERPNVINMQLSGIDVNAEEQTTKFSRFLIQGTNLKPGESDGILLGATMLKKYSTYADANIPGINFLKDIDIGSRVRVTITGSDGGKVSKEFIVKGILKSKVDEVSTKAFITAEEMRRLLPVHKQDYQNIAVRTDPAFASTLVKQTKEFMGSYEARIQTSDEAIPSFLRDIEKTMGLLGNALSSIALVVASITIFIVIFINAVTRRKYIGILKGIGISGSSIEVSYVLQSLFYAASGSVVGLILVYGFLLPYFNTHPINFPFSDGILVATPMGTFIRVVILFLATLIAGFIPARLIISKNTLDSILGRN